MYILNFNIRVKFVRAYENQYVLSLYADFDHAPFHPRKSIKKRYFNDMLFILANAINIRT